jgi:hypothetical protein
LKIDSIEGRKKKEGKIGREKRKREKNECKEERKKLRN